MADSTVAAVPHTPSNPRQDVCSAHRWAAADGHVYFLSERGLATVPGKEFRRLATNTLDGETLARSQYQKGLCSFARIRIRIESSTRSSRRSTSSELTAVENHLRRR